MDLSYKIKKSLPMRVLIACEEFQAVCNEMRRLGHICFSADIQECSGGHPEWHIMDDVLPIINGDCEFTTMDDKVHRINGERDLLIAHPPCTYISNAGACRLYPRKGEIDVNRYEKGIKAKRFFMKFLDAKCKRIVVENPLPSRVFELPKASQVIQPYEMYGKKHPYTKKTLLWIRGELDLLVPVEPVDPIGPYCPAGTSRKDRSKYGSAKRGDDRKNRSKTFPGIARAFAEQWAGDARWFWEEMDMNEELFIEAEKMLLDREGYCKNGCDNCKIKELGGFCAKERLEEWRDALK